MTRIIIALSIAILCSCGNAPERGEPILDGSYEPTPVPGASAASTTAAPATAEPAQNAEGVWHYTCPQGCAGGGGSAVPCGVCGTTLAHNQLYHSGGATPQPAITTSAGSTAGQPITVGGGTTINPLGGAPAPAAPAAAPATPEPAQNAAGVWHYTCSAGCAGGAGSAIACATCGNTLVHNSTYHN